MAKKKEKEGWQPEVGRDSSELSREGAGNGINNEH